VTLRKIRTAGNQVCAALAAAAFAAALALAG